ncbi:MAG: WbqC family protein [bacterium]|nr:WbqC family protein [bacterium]
MENQSAITIGIHQPNFMPWLGYFYKMKKCDIFVLLDDVQFIRRGFTSRVKIKTPEGEKWISVAVKKKGRYSQTINEVEVENDFKWKKRVLGSLQACYGKTPYFKTYFPPLEEIFQKEHLFLADLNRELLIWLAGEMGIKTKILKSSQLEGITGQSTDRLVSICQALGAHRYLSGFGGQNYQEETAFNQKGIELTVYDFKHPVYPQMFGEFVPGLSAVDLLFNRGPQIM